MVATVRANGLTIEAVPTGNRGIRQLEPTTQNWNCLKNKQNIYHGATENTEKNVCNYRLFHTFLTDSVSLCPPWLHGYYLAGSSGAGSDSNLIQWRLAANLRHAR